MEGIIKLISNRVRRNYLGGSGIDKFHGIRNSDHNNYPEEWIGSLVEANNAGMDEIVGEGLSYCICHGRKALLRDLIEHNRKYYLGDGVDLTGKPQMGVLVKILDSSMRLHIQVHPDRAYAQKYLNARYGKLECYYILSVQNPETASIWLGFQNSPGKDNWRRIVADQDKQAMEFCFENIYVKPGDIWVVPGGMPHAIGAGITMLEIMEPSDLVVRCEFEREGIVVPENARFMGQSLEDCLDIFDYSEYSAKEIRKKCNIIPRILKDTESVTWEQLIDEDVTEYFKVFRLTIKRDFVWRKPDYPVIAVITKGSVVVGDIFFQRGDSFFVAALQNEVNFTKINEEIQIIVVISN